MFGYKAINEQYNGCGASEPKHSYGIAYVAGRGKYGYITYILLLSVHYTYRYIDMNMVMSCIDR